MKKIGKIAALNMLGKNVPARSIPYFWTTQYGKSIRYCGHAIQYDDIILDGDPNTLSFVGYYCFKGNVVAAVSMARDPVVSTVAELMHHGKMPSAEEIRSGNVDLAGRL
jgi:hypothetical protein